MAQDKAPLVWVDMEMSGLVPDRDRILEVALVVTDGELNTIAEAPVWVVHQPMPAVVGTGHATKIIRSGMMLRVDGSTGAVSIAR